MTHPARFARQRALQPGTAAVLSAVLLLALGCNDACAATLSNLATSVGLFAALTALFVAKGWPVHLPASALPTAGGVLLVAGGAAWLWRARALRPVGPARAGVGASPSNSLRGVASAGLVLPAGMQRALLVTELCRQFERLQAAWDLGERQALQRLTTADMLDALCQELPGREPGSPSNRTDVVTLHAELLGFDELAGDYMVSVEFSGLIRESPEQGATPFRELWLLARSKQADSGWKLARHQALL